MERYGVTDRDLAAIRRILDPDRPCEPGADLAHSLLVDLHAVVPCDDVTIQVSNLADRTCRMDCTGGCDPADEAEEAEFWETYWDLMPSSYPQRTGSTDVTRLRDFSRDYLEREPDVRDRILVPLLFSDVDAHRLMFWRFEGSSFTERDVLLLTLLQPHLARLHADALLRQRGEVRLTPRQYEILRLVAAGCTNRKIGRAMGISEATVRTHLENIFARLGVHSRIEALAASGQLDRAS